ncbi:hypothetical protein M378DRAFT_16240 [Amanita muscaria Koide BX008]|uniref:Uncharacterized protein n=1 Tax=Amanita muscaria (strain Koide BX008) TaxID=946122 RepID=A0A0C2WL95_AMAMK|nr:hypothetical protein M378DRAFT_16240 [Amanita muscaria Koide BX008]
MVRVYHLLLLVLRPYWALKDLLLTIPRLELQLWDVHSHLTHLSNLAPAQAHLQRDVAAFAAILERVLRAAISTRDQLAAQNQALEALTAAVGLARQAHQSSNNFLLTMSETLQLLTRSIQELGQESEVNEAITLLCQIQEDTRYTRLVAEVDDPALQRHSESPAPRDPTPPVFGPNSPRYVPSSPTTAPPFAPLILDGSSPPCCFCDTPSTAMSLSPRGSSASDEPAEPDLRINYRIPVHYYPSQQDNDSFIQWELEDWDMIPYGGETFMLARRGPDHNPRFMALTINGPHQEGRSLSRLAPPIFLGSYCLRQSTRLALTQIVLLTIKNEKGLKPGTQTGAQTPSSEGVLVTHPRNSWAPSKTREQGVPITNTVHIESARANDSATLPFTEEIEDALHSAVIQEQLEEAAIASGLGYESQSSVDSREDIYRFFSTLP